MEILICMKQTFDTEEKIFIQNGEIDDDGVERIINPYCEYAVEEGIRIKEAHGGTVRLITIGGAEAEAAIRTAMAMGVDEGYRLDLTDFPADSDEQTTSECIVQLIKQKQIPYDVILCGYMSIDNGTAQVGPRIAELLGIPHISTITSLTVDGRQVQVERDVEGDLEKVESSLPILLTAQQGLNEPRYPRLPDIMKAKRKPLHRMKWDELRVDVQMIQARTKKVAILPVEEKETGQILSGTIKEQSQELIRLLHEEAKVL
ncbi:electron transfer flavoprotein beta subunit [Seinonella peptonophila]|uniref:Electron transfer flavoprotein subunit beta n=1 Tax=Seinonella peptonophila TaxID=112248 RepID=A0A1M4U4R9_9BACL|nr:electron transfer flavoprotein subunit beta/FixA family protein [Seinonella peptonophila]SHE51821.1 electron transfer flavoprotein beta subunit [Seinonella peptonophila]